MKRNRFILLFFIILTGVFASFFGGSYVRALFYTTLVIPVVALLYTFYVYIRFKVYQTIESKTVVKGEKTPYQFTLSNEDVIAYTNVNVTFIKNKSSIDNLVLSKSYCLVPKEGIDKLTSITCLYRGEYKVGIKSIVVTDFLNIFRITYPAPSTINMRVLPRVVKLDRLSIIPLDFDMKKSVFSLGNAQENIDIDMRKYSNGDNKKSIHWKASAKKQELFTRKYSDNPKSEIRLIMDLSIAKDDEINRIIIEDKIIETALAITDYFCRKGTPSTLLFDNDEKNLVHINSKSDFNVFYNFCADIKFESEVLVDKLISKSNQFISSGSFCIVITHSVTDELCKACYEALGLGNDVILILINNDKSGDLCFKLDSRVNVCQIAYDDEILDVLNK